MSCRVVSRKLALAVLPLAMCPNSRPVEVGRQREVKTRLMAVVRLSFALFPSLSFSPPPTILLRYIVYGGKILKPRYGVSVLGRMTRSPLTADITSVILLVLRNHSQVLNGCTMVKGIQHILHSLGRTSSGASTSLISL